MLFNSATFSLFFPIVTLLYFWLPARYRNAWLLLASCVFYVTFIPRYLLILFFTIGVDYFAGLAMENAQGSRRRWYLIASLVANIGVLAFFKYAGFFIENTNALLRLLGAERTFPGWQWVLPIGLSFHTFQAMSYTIEVYRGKQKAERSLLIYSLYVMFYPQLVAGPIERPQNLLPQFHASSEPTGDDLAVGFRLMLWGFFKKIFIADRLAIVVTHCYENSGRVHGAAAWLAVYFFAFQIYCDFSGYSDIARGTARVMGFRLMRNFDRPYFSASLGEFWRRWHISLSTWFKDYLYLPLGGNRVGRSRQAFNIFVVFLISGFWHGANWTFVVWGALHGSGFIFSQAWPTKWQLPNWLCTLLTFQFVSIAWIFFRAPTFVIAGQLCASLFDWRGSFSLNHFDSLGVSHFELLLCISSVSVLLAAEYALRHTHLLARFLSWPAWLRWLSYYGTTAAIVFLGNFSEQPFIYFQF
jgi:D-alanyl-lipoteichoic acid acyltransferase DltB (MBOAT superfamily)